MKDWFVAVLQEHFAKPASNAKAPSEWIKKNIALLPLVFDMPCLNKLLGAKDWSELPDDLMKMATCNSLGKMIFGPFTHHVVGTPENINRV